jgi:hypothetical protein
MMVTT